MPERQTSGLLDDQHENQHEQRLLVRIDVASVDGTTKRKGMP